jgi:urea carboxylase-associated protein 1
MKMSNAIDIGTVISDEIVEAGQAWARRIEKGERIRIVDLLGQQAVDFLLYDAVDRMDRYNAANTMKMAGNIFVTKGTVLYSDRGKPLMTVSEDTCGFHDTIGGCCSAEMNRLRYGKPGSGNCRDTFEKALKCFDLSRDDIVANVNWFMSVPVGPDGAMSIADSSSKPGDYVELIAERDVLCAISNCAQIFNASNGYNPTPIRVVLFAAPAPDLSAADLEPL